MSKLKKIGIGFGIGILSFFVLGISIATYNGLDDSPNNEVEKITQSQKIIPKESETTQEEWENVNTITMQDIVNKQEESVQKIKLDSEEKVLEFIQNYKGVDNAGPTLARTFEMISVILYPGENILASPSTTVSLFAHKDFDRTDYNRYWKIELEIKTYRETAYYEWIIDNETNLVYPGNDEGKEILDLLDTIDEEIG